MEKSLRKINDNNRTKHQVVHYLCPHTWS